MFAGNNKELQKILLLKNQGNYKEASEKLSEYEKKKITKKSRLRLQIIKAYFVTPNQNWEKSLEIIEQILPECEFFNNKLLLLDAQLVKSFCLTWGEKYVDSNKYIEEIAQFFENETIDITNELKLRKAWFLYIKGYNYNMMGQNSLARKTASASLNIAKQLTDQELQLKLLELLGNNEFQSAMMADSLEYYSMGFNLAKELNYDRYKRLFSLRLAEGYGGIGEINQSIKYCDITIELMRKQNQDPTQMLYWKAYLYYSIGEWDKALPLAKEALPSLEKDTSLWGRALYLDGKAAIERIEGSLDIAIEYMDEAISLVKERDDIFRFIVLLVRLAPMLFDKGEFERVLEICYTCLESLENNRNIGQQADVYLTMGKTFHVKGDYNLAIEYIQKGLQIFILPTDFAQSYFILIQIAIDKNDYNMLDKYLMELETLAKKHQTNYLEQIYQTAYALKLKNSSRPREWVKAIEILIDVVNKKLTRHDFTLVALINLCELLMNEFSISGDNQVLKELEFYVDELSKLASLQNIYHLRLEAYNFQILTKWLLAQRSMIDLEFNKTKDLLDKTRQLADEKGLLRLAEKLTQQQEKLLEQLSQWDDFIRKYYEFIKE